MTMTTRKIWLGGQILIFPQTYTRKSTPYLAFGQVVLRSEPASPILYLLTPRNSPNLPSFIPLIKILFSLSKLYNRLGLQGAILPKIVQITLKHFVTWHC